MPTLRLANKVLLMLGLSLGALGGLDATAWARRHTKLELRAYFSEVSQQFSALQGPLPAGPLQTVENQSVEKDDQPFPLDEYPVDMPFGLDFYAVRFRFRPRVGFRLSSIMTLRLVPELEISWSKMPWVHAPPHDAFDDPRLEPGMIH